MVLPARKNSMSRTKQEKHKALVLEAFDTLFNKRDYVTVERYWSPHYIQNCRTSNRAVRVYSTRSTPSQTLCVTKLVWSLPKETSLSHMGVFPGLGQW